MNLKSKNYTLKEFKLSYINNNYLSWFKDKQIKSYIDSKPKNLLQLEKEVKKFISDKKTIFWAIFKKKKHIGNIKIFEINKKTKFARLGILIGEEKYRNKGCGKEVIEKVTKYLLKQNLDKLWLGVGKKNYLAFNAYKKCQFEKYTYNNVYLNNRLKQNKKEYNKKHIFMVNYLKK